MQLLDSCLFDFEQKWISLWNVLYDGFCMVSQEISFASLLNCHVGGFDWQNISHVPASHLYRGELDRAQSAWVVGEGLSKDMILQVRPTWQGEISVNIRVKSVSVERSSENLLVWDCDWGLGHRMLYELGLSEGEQDGWCGRTKWRRVKYEISQERRFY